MSERTRDEALDPAFAMGRIDGEIRMHTQEEYEHRVRERDADEAIESSPRDPGTVA